MKLKWNYLLRNRERFYVHDEWWTIECLWIFIYEFPEIKLAIQKEEKTFYELRKGIEEMEKNISSLKQEEESLKKAMHDYEQYISILRKKTLLLRLNYVDY